ncbi:hypothetical protein [Actinocorallia longicatena]
MKALAPAAVLTAGLLVPAAPAAAAEECTGLDFGRLLQCLGDARQPKHAVTVNGEIPLDVPIGPALSLKQARESFVRSGLVVTVPKGVTTGQGGTILLILSGGRLLAPESAVTRLDRGQVEALRQFGACGDGLCDAVTGKGTVPGRQLIDGRLASDLATQAVTVGPTGPVAQEKDDDGGGGPLKGLTLMLIALALGLAGVLAFAARRRLAAVGPQSPPPGPPPTRPDPPAPARKAPPPTVPLSGHRVHRTGARPPGRGRRATVRTDLHPQGYVELDRDLYRAAWADPDTAPPAEGQPVDVVRDPDSDVLLAYPPGY